MKDNIIQATVSVALGALAAYFNVLLVPLTILIVVMIIDYATGMTSAWKSGELESKTGLIGLLKKVSYLVLVCVGGVVAVSYTHLDVYKRQNQNTVQTQENTKFCKHCGGKIAKESVICPLCGCQVEQITNTQGTQPIVINNTNNNTSEMCIRDSHICGQYRLFTANRATRAGVRALSEQRQTLSTA